MMSAAQAVDDVSRPLHRILVPLPYILLGVGTVLALLTPDQTTGERLGTAAIVAVTAVWALCMNTLRPRSWTGRTGPMLVYVGVQLALAGVLMARQPTFLVFGVIGFVQAYDLLPPFWALLDVGATAVLINLVVGGIPTDIAGLTLTLTIIGLQTSLISWFGYLGYRHNEQNERRRKAVAQLEAALAENAGLHAQLVAQAREAGVHDERQRMAREIHDTLAQGLTGIITQLQAADRVREQPELWQHHVDQINALARDSLAAARRSVAALGPPELDDSRLPDAIAELAARWSRTSAVPVHVEITGEPRPMLAEIEITLFRVAQEALANVARHAKASRAAVTLSYLDNVVLLDVRDNGVGFAVDVVPEHHAATDDSGFGLRAIRQRLERVKGTLAVESEPGEGTAVNASVPALSAEVGAP
ncbi:sensor histidine kinase [Kibdelosporangium aridum]|uniref:sensor histidine kinase n=1 Tax=Kibdelosporangium aridum TaxID=2030 RepID=UPI0035E65795